MISAFGVTHTVSKGVPKGLIAAAKGKPSKKSYYAGERLKAHREGQFGRSGPFAAHHRAEGKSARVRSRYSS